MDDINAPELLTEDSFRQALPRQMRKTVGPVILRYVNDLIQANPEENESLRNNILSFSTVLKDGKFKLNEYVNAVRFVSFKMLGETDKAAWVKVFPDRHQGMLDRGVTTKKISGYIWAYKGSMLVGLIMARTMVPVHIINQDMYQEALNAQRELMQTGRSEMVRMKAADSILNQLRPPEITKIELDIGYKEDSAIEELKRTTADLVRIQRDHIESGMSTVKQVAHSKVMASEVIEDAEYIEEEKNVG